MKRSATAALLLLASAACQDSTGSNDPDITVSVSPAAPTVLVGGTVQLDASAPGAGVTLTNADFSWQSLEPGNATVNAAGLVTGVTAGTARVVASYRGRADTVAVAVTPGGGTVTFNVNPNDACTNIQNRQARIVATTAHAIIAEDVGNPAGGFTPAEYQAIANEFEALIWPVDVANFGEPADMDGNGKVIILYTRAVNELTPSGADYVVGGFFWARDLFPRTSNTRFDGCAGSNAAEMFYMLAADPNGTINGHRRTKEYVRESTLGTVGHELQHLINASRRMYINNASGFEEVWLNEGLSHIAEDLLFYAKSGDQPRTNFTIADVTGTQARVDAFNLYGLDNMYRIREYLEDAGAYSPYGSDDDLATRGAAWHFLRYAADRRGGTEQTLWRALVNSTTAGLPNLQAALGQPSLVPWFRDWGVANYTDDAVAGVAAQYTHPSWNYRSIFSHQIFGGYPLETANLALGALNLELRGGSSAYVRFAVAPGQTADVRTALGGTTIPGACTPLNLALGQIVHLNPTDGAAVCLAGGATGAEYTLIPFNGSVTGGNRAALTVTGANVSTPTGPPSPQASPFQPGGLSLSRAAAEETAKGDGGFHLRLREREARELAGLMRGRGPSRGVLFDPAPATVTITYVRTR